MHAPTLIPRTARPAPSDLPAWVEGADLTAHDIDSDYGRRLRALSDAELAAEVETVEAEVEGWKQRIAHEMAAASDGLRVIATASRLRLPLAALPATERTVSLVNGYNEAHSRLIEARSEQSAPGRGRSL